MAATQFSRPCTIWDCLDHRHPLGIRIDDERRRLQKANAVLEALEYTLKEGEIEPIVAADAAGVVRELVEHAIGALDSVSLARGEARSPATESNWSEQPKAGPQGAEGLALDDTDDEEDEWSDADEDDKDI
jgi:hypothetical protein